MGFFGIEKELQTHGFIKLNDGDDVNLTFIPGGVEARTQVFNGKGFENFDPEKHDKSQASKSYVFQVIKWDDEGGGTRGRVSFSKKFAAKLSAVVEGAENPELSIIRVTRDGVGPKTNYIFKLLPKRADADLVNALSADVEDSEDVPF